MCTPTASAIAVTSSAILSTAMSATIGILQMKAQQAVSEYQNNEIMVQAEKMKDDAGKVRQAGIEEARNKRLQAILKMGSEKSKFAASNLSVSSDTLTDINSSIKENGELNALTCLNNAESRAQEYEFQADKLYSNAALRAFKDEQNYKAGQMQVLSNIVI